MRTDLVHEPVCLVRTVPCDAVQPMYRPVPRDDYPGQFGAVIADSRFNPPRRGPGTTFPDSGHWDAPPMGHKVA